MNSIVFSLETVIGYLPTKHEPFLKPKQCRNVSIGHITLALTTCTGYRLTLGDLHSWSVTLTFTGLWLWVAWTSSDTHGRLTCNVRNMRNDNGSAVGIQRWVGRLVKKKHLQFCFQPQVLSDRWGQTMDKLVTAPSPCLSAILTNTQLASTVPKDTWYKS